MGSKELSRFVRGGFDRLASESLIQFRRSPRAEGPLEVDEVFEVRIAKGARGRVRVAHVDENSFTIVTQVGHPEAGRITFGAYRTEKGDAIFHVRSVARSKSLIHYLGFLAVGDAMQTNTWTDLIDRLAHTVGKGVVGSIQAEVKRVEETDPAGTCDQPTFIAKDA